MPLHDPRMQVAGASTGAESAGDPAAWLADHGDALFRYAWARVRSDAAAEDLVQDTLLAAWEGRSRFRGGSTVRTWLTGILRFKVIDHLRRRGRERTLTDLSGTLEEAEQEAFNERLHWRSRELAPGDWEPEAGTDVDRAGFRGALEACLARLPPTASRVFLMREVDELETAEICKICAISPTNCFTLLHRARLALRRCLEETWFLRHDAR